MERWRKGGGPGAEEMTEATNAGNSTFIPYLLNIIGQSTTGCMLRHCDTGPSFGLLLVWRLFDRSSRTTDQQAVPCYTNVNNGGFVKLVSQTDRQSRFTELIHERKRARDKTWAHSWQAMLAPFYLWVIDFFSNISSQNRTKHLTTPVQWKLLVLEIIWLWFVCCWL